MRSRGSPRESTSTAGARPRREEFLDLFHEFFVRTYVQRLLLFDAPDFTYGDGEGERRPGHRSATEVVTPGDRFAVDYTLHRNPDGWRATDIVVEGVSLARNFRVPVRRGASPRTPSRVCSIACVPRSRRTGQANAR